MPEERGQGGGLLGDPVQDYLNILFQKFFRFLSICFVHSSTIGFWFVSTLMAADPCILPTVEQMLSLCEQ